jgi:hypothetical protein
MEKGLPGKHSVVTAKKLENNGWEAFGGYGEEARK